MGLEDGGGCSDTALTSLSLHPCLLHPEYTPVGEKRSALLCTLAVSWLCPTSRHYPQSGIAPWPRSGIMSWRWLSMEAAIHGVRRLTWRWPHATNRKHQLRASLATCPGHKPPWPRAPLAARPGVEFWWCLGVAPRHGGVPWCFCVPLSSLAECVIGE
jgi:hypothetical protein